MKDKLLKDNFIPTSRKMYLQPLAVKLLTTISEYEEKYYETIIFKYCFLELETSLNMQLTSNFI